MELFSWLVIFVTAFTSQILGTGVPRTTELWVQNTVRSSCNMGLCAQDQNWSMSWRMTVGYTKWDEKGVDYNFMFSYVSLCPLQLLERV
jgi:hypothetical protein